VSRDYVLLKCENCGAPLEVSDDTERVACMHCKATMLAVRRGGAVSLKRVEEKLGAIVGTLDRSADELTLMRLRSDLEAVQRELVPMRDRMHTIVGVGFLVSAAFLIVGLLMIKSWGVLILLTAIMSFVFTLWSERKLSAHPLTLREREIESRMRALRARVDAVG
jgi:DNA-directed RNA polymerase subunit RPC12/RpoP